MSKLLAAVTVAVNLSAGSVDSFGGDAAVIANGFLPGLRSRMFAEPNETIRNLVYPKDACRPVVETVPAQDDFESAPHFEIGRERPCNSRGAQRNLLCWIITGVDCGTYSDFVRPAVQE